MSVLRPVIIGICAVSGAFLLQDKGWRGIVPLHSTRANVEALLGPASGSCKCIYKTAKESVEVKYATAPCKGTPAGWNVPSGTVLSVTVTPKGWQRFADLGLEEANYVKTFDPDNPTTHYSNRTEGIRYTVTETGMVYYISYTPSTKDSQLRCAGFPQNAETATSVDSRFDYYANISFKDEKARLDNFAAWLHEHADLNGYIIVYGDSNADKQLQAQKRADRAKHYLVTTRNLESNRLFIINGGFRKKLEVELYALPLNLPAPKPVPQ